MIAVGLAGALPYVVFLLAHYGWQEAGPAVRQLWYKPGYQAGFYDVFSVSLAHGFVFFLSLLGIVGMAIRRLRRDAIWLALLGGASLLWPVQLVLLRFERGGEPDELYFFTRFLLTFCAGVGAFFLVKLGGRLLRTKSYLVGAGGVAVLMLLTLPQSFPYWWYPPAMDRYYEVGLDPIPEEILGLTDWIREETSPDAVFVAESDLSTWIAALAGRRAFLSRLRPPSDYRERRLLERRILTDTDRDALGEAHDRYGITHLALDDAFLSSFGRTRADLESVPWLEIVYEGEAFTVLALRLEASPRAEARLDVTTGDEG